MERVILAATLDIKKDPKALHKLRYPLALSPKLDGIRITPRNKVVWSRKGLEIPSRQVQAMFGHLHGLDGEVIYDHPTIPNVYNITQSYVMSYSKPAVDTEGRPLMRFYVFDRIPLEGPDLGFAARYDSLPKGDDWLIRVDQRIVKNVDDVLEQEEAYLNEGYEGIMLRELFGGYKFNRSTLNEQLLMKLKRFIEFEAPIVGFVEELKNNNELTYDNLGYAKRSKAKAGLAPNNTLGAFLVLYNNKVIRVSCGSLNHEGRLLIWNNQAMFLGKIVVVRHFGRNLVGYDPRHTRFVGWRNDGR